MSDVPEPRSFYTRQIPAQFNRALDSQPRETEEEKRVYADLVAVDATLRVEVGGDGGGVFFLNIREGRMSADEKADRTPLLTMIQDRAAYERLASEAGDSAMALLGGLSGLAGEMKLTRARIENLRNVRGAVRFEVSGDRGFALLTHFGPDPVPEEPATSITVDEDAYAELRSGRLDPTRAFMEGRIDVQGDVQLAMQLALAAISPD